MVWVDPVGDVEGFPDDGVGIKRGVAVGVVEAVVVEEIVEAGLLVVGGGCCQKPCGGYPLEPGFPVGW